MKRLSLSEIVLVTGNPDKLAETRRITGVEIEGLAIDLPEIQSLDLEQVVRAKAEEAWRRVGRPVVVEETGLELAALNGFPGPLVKWMLDAVGPEGIARTAHRLGDPRAVARCQLLVTDGERTLLAEGATEGVLVLPPRGADGFGWDPVFQPDGHDRTYAELGAEIKDRIGHRGRAWAALITKSAS